MLWLATSWLQKGTNFKIHCLSGSSYEYLKMMMVLTMMAENKATIWKVIKAITRIIKISGTMEKGWLKFDMDPNLNVEERWVINEVVLNNKC